MQTRRFRWIFYPAALITLLLAAVLVWLDQFLVTPIAPQGMISFELARTPDVARAIIDSWELKGAERAAWSIMLDFPFLVGYVTVFVCLSLLIETPVRSLVIGGFILAGLCDFFENLALMQILAGDIHPSYTHIAFWCASVKFGLLVVGWFYLLICGVYALYLRLRR